MYLGSRGACGKQTQTYIAWFSATYDSRFSARACDAVIEGTPSCDHQRDEGTGSWRNPRADARDGILWRHEVWRRCRSKRSGGGLQRPGFKKRACTVWGRRSWKFIFASRHQVSLGLEGRGWARKAVGGQRDPTKICPAGCWSAGPKMTGCRGARALLKVPASAAGLLSHAPVAFPRGH